MIELTLNLIWAAVAITAFAFVLPRTRQRWAASIALSCILVLLFPIISVSDDLSAQWEAIEATAVRRVQHVLHVQAIFVALTTFVFTLALIGATECHVVPTPSVLLAVRNSPRSPPRCQ